MDLRVLSTGKTFYQIDSGVAAVLLEMFPAAIEQINKPRVSNATGNDTLPRRPRKPEWEIAQNAAGASCIHGKLPSGENVWYDGAPRRAATILAAYGHEVPKAILEEYSVVKSAFVANSSAAALERYRP